MPTSTGRLLLGSAVRTSASANANAPVSVPLLTRLTTFFLNRRKRLGHTKIHGPVPQPSTYPPLRLRPLPRPNN